MKKTIYLFITVLTFIFLTGCGGDSNNGVDNRSYDNSSESNNSNETQRFEVVAWADFDNIFGVYEDSADEPYGMNKVKVLYIEDFAEIKEALITKGYTTMYETLPNAAKYQLNNASSGIKYSVIYQVNGNINRLTIQMYTTSNFSALTDSHFEDEFGFIKGDIMQVEILKQFPSDLNTVDYMRALEQDGFTIYGDHPHNQAKKYSSADNKTYTLDHSIKTLNYRVYAGER